MSVLQSEWLWLLGSQLAWPLALGLESVSALLSGSLWVLALDWPQHRKAIGRLKYHPRKAGSDR